MQRYKLTTIDEDNNEQVTLHYTMPKPDIARWRLLDRKTGKTTDSGNLPKAVLQRK